MHTLYCSSSSKLYIYHDVVYGNKQFVTVCVLNVCVRSCLITLCVQGTFLFVFYLFCVCKKGLVSVFITVEHTSLCDKYFCGIPLCGEIK